MILPGRSTLRCVLVGIAALCVSLLHAASAAAATPIRFVTDWKAQAEHGGFYEAVAEGLYRRAGLDVRILQGGPSINVPQLLAAGAADFGIGSNGFIPLNLVRQGVPLKSIMAVFQKDPQVLITHPRADVRSLSDMKGKPILIADASANTFFLWLKAKYGFEDSQIRKYTFNLAPFLVNPNAIQEGYLTSEPYTIETQGHIKPNVFLLADNGYPGYANMVLAPESRIASDPALVQAFVNATEQGWYDYLFVNPVPANAMIKHDNPDMSDTLIAQAISKLKNFGIVMSGDALALGIGAMTDTRWKTFFDTMCRDGLYSARLPYRSAYELKFIVQGLHLGAAKGR
jgi:NitT/TauT family transport system substrate-binding protein